jgi:hypothetical protein
LKTVSRFDGEVAMDSGNASLFGEFLIITRAEMRGDHWLGFYKLNQFADDGKTSTVFEDEEEIDERFESEAAALQAARKAAEASITRGKAPKWD